MGLRIFPGVSYSSFCSVYILHLEQEDPRSGAPVADSFCGSTPVLLIDSLTGVPTSTTELFSESKSTPEHYYRVKFLVLRFSVLSFLGSSLSSAETTYKAVVPVGSTDKAECRAGGNSNSHRPYHQRCFQGPRLQLLPLMVTSLTLQSSNTSLW